MTTEQWPELPGRLYRDGAELVDNTPPVEKRDSLGIVYDSSWTDSYGTTHYTRDHASGTGAGPAQWSTEHDCNPICGCHLSAKCLGCNVCMNCEGCYCREGDDW